MSPLKRWSTMAAAAMFVGLTMQTALAAQESTLPRDGKALATQLGLSQDSAAKLMPDLNALAAALTRHDQIREQAESVRAELHEALTRVAPGLSLEQRRQLMGLVWQGGGPGYGMRGGMGAGMGQNMHPGMGQGMHRGMGPGTGPANCPYHEVQPQGADSIGTGGAPQGR